MALIELTVENAEPTATPRFVLYESVESTPDTDTDFDASVSNPESHGKGLGAILALGGLAVAVWIARRWM